MIEEKVKELEREGLYRKIVLPPEDDNGKVGLWEVTPVKEGTILFSETH